ncbi:MAG: GNAT family N-acetyltransferase [Brevinema sp.]
MKEFKIETTPYHIVSDRIKNDIVTLLQHTYGYQEENCHRPELKAQSFYCYSEDKMITYLGVVRMMINHVGLTFNIMGLSCIAIEESFRGRGLGTILIKVATEWIEKNKNIDFGVFTCCPSLVAFYGKAGWIKKDAVLLGSHDPQAITSKTIDVEVLFSFF